MTVTDRHETIGEAMRRNGISRRTLMKYCGGIAASMALPASVVPAMAERVLQSRRQSVIWFSCQECTGCVESLTRSYSPTLENMLFNMISLDYQEALMAAAGQQAMDAIHAAAKENEGQFILVVDGSIPSGLNGAYSCVNGRTNLDELEELGNMAGAIVAIGTCASYGGVGAAFPNPTGAKGTMSHLRDLGIRTPCINVPGCPPMPEVMTGVLTSFLTFGRLPEVDRHGRPVAFFGNTIHDRCYRRPFYEQGKFAKSFDDAGARAGWCLFDLGCKGPTTNNACATIKWNGGSYWPIQGGHGCIGCSEPNFWDKGSFYKALSAPTVSNPGLIMGAAAAGAAVGVAAAAATRVNRNRLTKNKED